MRAYDNFFPFIQGYEADFFCPDDVTLPNIPCPNRPPAHNSALMRLIYQNVKRGIMGPSVSPFSTRLLDGRHWNKISRITDTHIFFLMIS